EEYWTIEADFILASGETFRAKLEKINGEKTKIGSKEEAEKVRAAVEGKAFVVSGVDEKERFVTPYPAFKTSSLQQEASNRLKFSPKKTMLLAQKLFEGVEMGKSTTGLITYMRTDSVRVSDEALSEVRRLVETRFGADYVPHKPNVYTNSKSAQDAHEAIRPTDVTLTPEKVHPYLEKDMFGLYELIWRRFVSSQMSRMQLHVKVAEVSDNGYLFVARGSKVIFDGFSKVYEAEKKEDERTYLPDMAKGDSLRLKEVVPTQRFTQPPARYTEASLIKTLEAKGVGRPSTYAAIVSTIQERGYVHKEKGSLVVIPLGRTVNRLLAEFFPKVIDVDFTARMEDGLDLIEEDAKDWVASLTEFYSLLQGELSTAKSTMKNLKQEEKETSIICDRCGKPMVLRWGKNGEYLVCSGRPECKNKKNVKVDKDGQITVVEEESRGICPKCGGTLVEKSGRFGRFIACSNYPDCKFTRPYTLGLHCPMENCTGEVVERISKKKKKFYGCSRYPDCDFITGLAPKEGECPSCGAPVLFSFRDRLSCLRKGCGWTSR
ncbi:MAG TPA: type I DNA topoisomerase, partial [Syntrophorhabdales bacterium]|nr:type I DNA topoisomerase [Syntrophorhabdales bacterium]